MSIMLIPIYLFDRIYLITIIKLYLRNLDKEKNVSEFYVKCILR